MDKLLAAHRLLSGFVRVTVTKVTRVTDSGAFAMTLARLRECLKVERERAEKRGIRAVDHRKADVGKDYLTPFRAQEKGGPESPDRPSLS
jgi:hypothetical protein